MATEEVPLNGESHTEKRDEESPSVATGNSENGEKPIANEFSKRGTRQTEVKNEEKRPSKLKAMWEKLGLDAPTLMMMFKGSVAPTIAIAFYESDSVSRTYTTLGYLVAIICVLSLPIMPRAKFFQTMILNLFAVCLGASIGILGLWSCIKAREHTSTPGVPQAYNSSQAAVCAIWLFANIWFANLLRAKIPALNVPVIMYSIFANIAFTSGPIIPTFALAESLIKQMLKAFLTAFAISTAVNLFVIPISCRLVVFKGQAGYIQLLRGVLKAQTKYLSSLEESDMFAGPATENSDTAGSRSGESKKSDVESSHPALSPEAKALKGAIDGLRGMHGKLYGDMPFAKREVAWGKLDAKDMDKIFNLFQDIMIPLLGMSTITDIFVRIGEKRGWVKPTGSNARSEQWEHMTLESKAEEKRLWNEVMKTLHEPFAIVSAVMDQGLEHAALTLELISRPKEKAAGDIETAAEQSKPGDAGFLAYMEKTLNEFYKERGATLKKWAQEKGLSAEQFDASGPIPAVGEPVTGDKASHRRDQQQLYLILFMENLLYTAGLAVMKLVRFADGKVEDGSMKKNRLILPGQRRVKKWILGLAKADTTVDSNTPDNQEAGINNVYLGSGFNPRKDPEHLPPNTAWQHFGNGLRTIPRFLGSEESAFGFRVACATLTLGIVAFLKDTHVFFQQQRLVWALIMIAIGMTMTSGQSIFGFLARVIGTALAMVTSIVIWYIVDQKTPGVIVMLWFFIFMEMYLFLKFPRFIPAWLVFIVTQVMIVGYELQVRKIGIAASTSSGEPYYPIYELGPYRLACVAGGSFVAFIWTFFPYPLTDRSWLRKDLGATLYILANYYSMVHSTIRSRMHGTEGDMSLKSSPGRRLEKARQRMFGKLLLLLPSLQQHADWQRFEPTIGGKFPRETYNNITQKCSNIMGYLALMSYTTKAWSRDADTKTDTRSKWLRDLAVIMEQIEPTSHQITSTLALLSAAISSGVALPPFIQLPQPYSLTSRLEALDSGILDSRHVEEPGYSAYAVMQVASSLVTDDLAGLVDCVKELVGETDFSFTVGGSEDSLTGSEGIGRKGKKD
ncbi:6591b8dc-15cf-408f-bb8d-ed5171e1b646 [Sclerotinia trifoliorum]|uniref:6591b8dc-15cf-408f-bb8d-ed5171e1b646 n=1 Tax=Sclerotinia trifoliorum TaxID=28548 RepID=A0A8H2ZRJ6_9HELO|nr:6591b8dc-15cf-408f-bb8d-ed5171e1b646 [Sclerotinia trifoliorum]